jgi:HlyD family secretion protein
MASKDLRPEQRLGRGNPKRTKMIFWAVGLLACGSGLYAAYHYASTTEVEIPVARVRKGDFVISVRTRGDIKSTRSIFVTAPQVPSLRIVRLAKNGQSVHKGEVVVEFDREAQENNIISRQNMVQQYQGTITQQLASRKMQDEQDAFSKVQNEFSLERAKLEASRAAVLSPIDGEKNRISVTVAEGTLQTTRAKMNANDVSADATMLRANQQLNNADKNLKLTQSYLTQMELRAPADGVVNILPNFNARGTFGRSGQPPFKEGDSVWTGAQIMEIPDLSEMYIDLKLDEVDRGKIALAQNVKVRVDSIPDKEFLGVLDFISPAATVVYTGSGTNQQTNADKVFPATATLKALDPRLRPGTSASAEVIIERQADSLMIPVRANFDKNGKPAVYVQKGAGFELRQVQVGKRNEDDVVIVGGLKEGDVVALEDPVKLAKKGKKKI